MEIVKATKKPKSRKLGFYMASQNNSGGSFDVTEDVAHRVVIEAYSADEADAILDRITANQSGSCSCCGERWSSIDDYDLIDLKELSKGWKKEFNTLEDYLQFLADSYGWTTPDAIVHFANGDKGKVYKQSKSK